MLLEFSNYNDCSGTVLDGGVTFDIKDWDFYRDDLGSGSIEFSKVTLRDQEANLSLHGDLNYHLEPGTATESFNMHSLEINDNVNGKQYWFENYQQVTKYDDSRSLTNEIGLNIQGRLYLSDQGFIDVETNTDLVCVASDRSYCLADVIGTGKVIINGNQNSKAILSFVEHKYEDYGQILKILIDENGNGAAKPLELVHLGGTSSDTPPFAFAGDDIAVNFNGSNKVSLSGLLSFDADGDSFSYSWHVEPASSYLCQLSVNFSSHASNIQLINEETATPSVIVSEYGEYCIGLTVTDDTGNKSTDSIAVRFNKIELFDTYRQEMVVDGRFTRLNSMTTVDIDADGKHELFLHHNTGTRGYVFNRNEQGSYDHLVTNKLESSLSRGRHNFADITGDGNPEWLFIEGRGLTSALVYSPISPSGELGPQVELTEVPNVSLKWPQVVDLNGDEIPDIFMNLEHVYKELHFGLQSEQGEFDFVVFDRDSSVDIPNTQSLTAFAVGDIDSDGQTELAVLIRRSFGDLYLQIVSFDGKDFITTQEVQVDDDCNLSAERACFPYNFTIQDLNGDGVSEIVFALGQRYKGYELFVYSIDGDTLSGTSTFLDTLPVEVRHSYNSVELEDRPARFADFNADGLLDILVNVNFDYSLLLFQQEGKTFGPSVRIPFISQDALIEDINEDGKPDVVMTTGRELLIHLNKFTK
ncbi:FG-GAP repeat domain-containing protein [Paraglaciecola arctica]|uniref:FG-GAP repeat domain-containing protein n=1 Tax=Paraglaciecola arctica TaxID=1128911 RepID=UPI00129B6794|nr:VCBS repeat-containing protein [Paraglaciecola arctica]